MKPTLTVGAGLAALALTAVATAPGAYAAEGDVDVVNTETVQVYVNADGDVESQRVYEQLTMTGSGQVEVANPIEESGLRNLDGFDGYSVEDGVQNVEVDVDGTERLRSVSDYTGELPLDISIEYRLDGELVEPGDVVGETGELEVLYTVKNITAQQQEVTFDDGKGGTVTEMAEVPIPMVGSLTTVAPPNFTEVSSEQANLAGDGKGGTKMSFTMTLFPPLGSDEVQFGYTANVTDAVVPSSSVSALPVNPLESPSFKTAGESYQSGSETGIKLAEGATEIDTNLLKLRDGAATLLAGLIQLSDGADELNAGLAGEAAPGAQKLADGAGELNDGLGQIDDGAGQLADGAGKASDGGDQLAAGAGELNDGLGKIDAGAGDLADGAGRLAGGTGDALTGSKKLEGGLKQIRDGLAQLSDVEGLPKALAGAKQLKAGVDEIVTKVGSASTPGTLLWGINQLAVKLPAAETGSAQILGGLQNQLRPGLAQAKGGVDQVQGGLAAAVATGGSLDQLTAGLDGLRGFCDVDEPTCGPTITALQDGVATSKSNLTAANQGLLQVSGGLGTAIGALDAQLIPGATALNSGLTEAAAGAAQLDANGPALRTGLLQVQAGLADLVTGLTGAVGGASQLAAGADEAYAGSGDLSDGLSQIDGGANELADGAGRLAAGTGDAEAGSQKLAVGAGDLAAGLNTLTAGALKLAGGTGDAAEGSTLLADGAGDLAEGLGDAAEGSGRLADGMAEAADGAPALVDGAGRLSDEGMSQLIDAGTDTAQDYGKLYAVIAAGAERADTERMAYGAPEDAVGQTAYTYELLGDDGESGRNTKRGLAALALLGLGGGAILVGRRFV
ncbi:hypothetical protein [Nocardioides euryhalodurans]|uniref:Choice-of-anchor G family protein n=1 Tax=Nocardioides euryhalodurans TaxID=2518370 RepID=A0A4P7GGN8_9ACTN|nr:hypothetical protein [Nocardioides euryhalodurans]QBR90903.1 hypothetical protein EXE57_00410 [Nocardioides euryhalodurans]